MTAVQFLQTPAEELPTEIAALVWSAFAVEFVVAAHDAPVQANVVEFPIASALLPLSAVADVSVVEVEATVRTDVALPIVDAVLELVACEFVLEIAVQSRQRLEYPAFGHLQRNRLMTKLST